jgi:hypothetical protein
MIEIRMMNTALIGAENENTFRYSAFFQQERILDVKKQGPNPLISEV